MSDGATTAQAPARSDLVLVAGWAVLGLLVAGYVGSFYVPAFAGDPVWRLVGQAVYLAAHFAAAALAGAVAVREAPGFERRFWLYLSISCWLLLAYETLFSYQILAGLPADWPPLQLGAVLSVVAAGLFVIALSMLSRLGQAGTLVRSRVLVDITIEFLLGVLVMLIVLVYPVLSVFAASPDVLLFASTLSTAGVLILIWSGLLAFGYRSDAASWQPWERLIVAGVAVYGAGAALWPFYWVASTVWNDSHVFHVVVAFWFLGMGLAAVGAVYRLVQPSGGDLGLGRKTPYVPRRGVWAVPIYTAAVLSFVALWAAGGPDPAAFRTLLSMSVPVFVILILTRSLLVSLESERRMAASDTDPISGLGTLSALDRRLARAIEVAGRYGEQVSLIVADLDRFGEIDDTRGHQGGDLALAAMGDALRAAASGERRSEWFAARTTGDEFAVVVPSANGIEGFKASERIRVETAGAARRSRLPLSASMGVAVYPGHASDVPGLFAAAREALQVAKQAESGRVVVFDPEKSAVRHERAGDDTAYLETIRLLARSVELRTPHLEGHGERTARLAVALGRELHLDEERLRLLEIAGELHDIGYIAVPDAILEKPGPLDPSERRLVESHPEMGSRIIASLDLPEVLPWVRSHHERWDGRGYPRGISGGEIPLGARILAVCDAYDAMTSERPYRRALRHDEALEELTTGRGGAYDPATVDEFVLMLATRGLETADDAR